MSYKDCENLSDYKDSITPQYEWRDPRRAAGLKLAASMALFGALFYGAQNPDRIGSAWERLKDVATEQSSISENVNYLDSAGTPPGSGQS
jgi:hypothetical protein